jgi:uroporphyrinogen-III synthase
MPQDAADALRQGILDAALFYSPRSAAVFRACVRAEGLPVEGLFAACISPAAVAALAPLILREVRAATRPNQAALLALLD